MPVKITSRYTPLTYDEITKPLIQATEAQMAVENAYADAQDKAALAMAQASQESDPITYNRLRSYAEDLQAHANALARYGLQSNSRQSLLDMRRRYGQEITPIETAIANRDALIKEQRKLKASNPYLMQERDMSRVSLDEMLNNPNLDYGRSIDGSQLANRAAAITKAIGQAQHSIENGQRVDRYTKELLTKEGFTPAQIEDAIAGGGYGLTKMLGEALDNLYMSSGVDNFSIEDQDAAWNYIQEGARLGMGTVKSQIMADAEAKRRDELADRKHSEDFQRELYGIRYGNSNTLPASINPNTNQSYRDGELTRVGDHWENSDGDMFTRVRKDVYAPYIKEKKLSDAQKNALSSWKIKNGGYLAGFDEDDDYENPHTEFVKVLSRNISDAGNLTANVKTISASSDLKELNAKEREKVEATISDTKLPSDNFTVIKVKRYGTIDDDVFVVYNNALDALLAEAKNKKEGEGYVIPDYNDDNEGLQGTTRQHPEPNSASQNYFNSIGAGMGR